MVASFVSQMRALLWRNYLLKRRNMKQLWQEILFPVFYLSILIMMKALLKPETKPAASFPVNPLANFSIDTSKHLVVVSPPGLNVEGLMKKISAHLNATYLMFNSSSTAEAEYRQNASNISAGIIFGYTPTGMMLDSLQYAIRMPFDSIPSTKETFRLELSQASCREKDNVQGTGTLDCLVNSYLSTGFAYLQSIIDHALIQSENITVPNVEVGVQMMSKDELTTDLTFLQSLSSIYFVIAYSFFINFLTVNLVAEKEKKIREGMFMMGLRNSVFWLSWIVVYFLVILLVSAVVTFMAQAASFFQQSNMFLLFAMLMLYGMSIIAIAFLLTPFFNKARVAGAVASTSTIIISLFYLAISQTRTPTATGYNYGVPPSAQWAMCLLSPVAFALAIDQGIFLDIARGGMNFDTINVGDFPLFASMIMLLVDIVLYFFLAIYLDHVIPGEYGVRYKPWYFLQKSYWCSHQSKNGERMHLISNPDQITSGGVLFGPNIEPVSSSIHSQNTLRIINMSKTFKSEKDTLHALNDFSLDIYEGQITALLGHNGAGKTTLINILTGLIPPTIGTATIRGLDVTSSGDMEEIRSMCGICPQHNILYDELTCKEHLHMFAGIKGVPINKIPSEVVRALNSVDLKDKQDIYASKLSGGEKRKLSVAMALIGDPKIIFLDEPTAGMDPYSRRHVWSLLKSNKEGRIILITTHFMDEADILADRKAIISHGQLQCCGSSLFLKNKFGIGYHINMVVEVSCNFEKVTELLQTYISGAKFQRSHGKELSYIIPISEVDKFADLFKTLEQCDESGKSMALSLGICSYGVSMPTLEEVFLKLGEDTGLEQKEFLENRQNPSYQGSGQQLDISIPRNIADSTNVEMRESIVDVFKILPTVEENIHQKRNCFWALFKVRYLFTIRSKAALFFQIFLPIGLVAGGIALTSQATPIGVVNPTPLKLRGNLYAYQHEAQNINLLKYLLVDSVNDAVSISVGEKLNTSYFVDKYLGNKTITKQHFIGMNILATETMTNNIRQYIALYNDTGIHSLPAVINSVSTVILQQANSRKNITTYSWPWPSKDQKHFAPKSFSASLMVGLAFVMIAPGFAMTVVYERQYKVKNLLRVSGVTFNMYWGTLFVFDLIVFIIPATVCLIIALAMQVPSLMPAGAILMLILLFIVFIPQTLMLTLVLSFMFDKFETCQAFLPNIFTLGGLLPYLVVSLLDMLGESSVAKILHYVFVFVNPLYTIFGGFYYIDRMYQTSSAMDIEPTISDYFKFNNNILICILVPLLDFVLMCFLLRILDVCSNGGNCWEALCIELSSNECITPSFNVDKIDNEDEDVAIERERVERLEDSAEERESCVAYVQQLRKEFTESQTSSSCKTKTNKVKVAVCNLSFAVNKGEVLGLLGPNGAGKTTCLSMMTAEVHPTQGKVVIAGHNVRSNVSEAFQAMGFCPQHDALWDTISLSEHLQCYAAIKGIHKKDISQIIDYFLQNLKLSEHCNKRAKKLSGGTRRKLSYAISMLGWPRIVLLDEPSTGMDPQSKRFLWDTINSSFQGKDCGAILTTHYMEEADALCSRAGIMVNGRLECLGPTQHLKTKYGSGYLLEVKLAVNADDTKEILDNRMAALERHLQLLFPTSSCLESFAERAQYTIPSDNVSLLSSAFAALENIKTSHRVEEYSFSQSTLEQVFLRFAKKQLEEGEDENNIKIKGIHGKKLIPCSENIQPTKIEDNTQKVEETASYTSSNVDSGHAEKE